MCRPRVPASTLLTSSCTRDALCTVSPPLQACSLPQKLVLWVVHAHSGHSKMCAPHCALPSYAVQNICVHIVRLLHRQHGWRALALERGCCIEMQQLPLQAKQSPGTNLIVQFARIMSW